MIGRAWVLTFPLANLRFLLFAVGLQSLHVPRQLLLELLRLPLLAVGARALSISPRRKTSRSAIFERVRNRSRRSRFSAVR